MHFVHHSIVLVLNLICCLTAIWTVLKLIYGQKHLVGVFRKSSIFQTCLCILCIGWQ